MIKLIPISVAFLVLVIMNYSCKDKADLLSNNGSSVENYQETNMSQDELEVASPGQFLSDNETTFKQDVSTGKWIIEGTLMNSASNANYRDAVLEISFYDQQGDLLGTNTGAIHQAIKTDASIPFKLIVDGFAGTTSIATKVKSATVIPD